MGILLSGSVCVLFFFFFRWQDRLYPNWLSTIESDGTGYYVYLPSFFLYQDINHSYLYEPELYKRYDKSISFSVDTHPNGRKYSKCFMGVSILMIPFFLIGIFLSWILGFPVDGYSIPFQFMVFLAALSYMLAGLSLISRVLKKLEFSEKVIGATLICIALGTNLLNYTWFEASFSHVYEFFMVSLLLYWAQMYFNDPSKRILYRLCFLFGLMIITRPTTAMAIIGIGLVIETKEDFIKGIRFPFQNILSPWLPLALFFIPIALQLFVIYLQVGTWWFFTYQGEGFNFLNPQTIKFLFGYEKGLFIYSPILIFSIIGAVLLWKKRKVKSIIFFVQFLLVAYVLSSWWAWAFGGGFGSRPFVDYYSIMAIPMAFFFSLFRGRAQGVLLSSIIIPLLALSIIYHYQYRYFIIAWSGMDGPKYWQVFLKTDRVFGWSTSDDTFQIGNVIPEKSKEFNCDFDNVCVSNFVEQKGTDLLQIETQSGLGRLVNKQEAFGALFRIDANSIIDSNFKLLISYDCLMKISDKSTKAIVVCAVDGKEEGWQGLKINKQVRAANQWTQAHFEFEMKYPLQVTDTISMALYNESGSNITIDDVKIGIHYLKN